MRVEKMNTAQLREEVLRLRFKRHEQRKAFRALQQAILDKNAQISNLEVKLTGKFAVAPATAFAAGGKGGSGVLGAGGDGGLAAVFGAGVGRAAGGGAG